MQNKRKMRGYSIFNNNSSSSKRNRTNAQNFTVDVLEDGDPLTKIKHHRLGTFFVGQPNKEFTVRVTIHSDAWKIHRANNYKVVLYLDGKEVRSKFMKRPNMYDDADVAWTFDSLPSGHAFQFGDRKGGGKNREFGKSDEGVGKLRVTFQAANQKYISPMEYEYLQQRAEKRKEDGEKFKPKEWDAAPKVKFDGSSKDRFGTLRTIKGRMVRKPRQGGNRGPGPKFDVDDFIYADIVIFYDSADHLEYRGILRPQYQKEHRYFFPNRDFSKTKKAKPPTKVVDLTGRKVVERKITKRERERGVKNETNDEGEWVAVFDN